MYSLAAIRQAGLRVQALGPDPLSVFQGSHSPFSSSLARDMMPLSNNFLAVLK